MKVSSFWYIMLKKAVNAAQSVSKLNGTELILCVHKLLRPFFLSSSGPNQSLSEFVSNVYEGNIKIVC